MTITPLSAGARKALAILESGGRFWHGIVEEGIINQREMRRTHLYDAADKRVAGIGTKVAKELLAARLIEAAEFHYESTVYKLRV